MGGPTTSAVGTRAPLPFDVSNTDHVMPVNIGDRVSLLCPKPGPNYEYSNIYAVNVKNHDVAHGNQLATHT
ncbi:hypothetical protein OSTOST_15912 [Ostertagia ostertagi]